MEQNAQKILDFTDRAVILERGSIAYQGDSAALKDDPTLLETHLGVAKTNGRKARRPTRERRP